MARQFTNDKVVSEMTNDGLQEHNLNTDETVRVSQRSEDQAFARGASVEDEVKEVYKLTKADKISKTLTTIEMLEKVLSTLR